MTDRLHSCKDSPTGRHNHDHVEASPEPGVVTITLTRCCYCGRKPPSILGRIRGDVGWTVPAPDGHLGGVE